MVSEKGKGRNHETGKKQKRNEQADGTMGGIDSNRKQVSASDGISHFSAALPCVR